MCYIPYCSNQQSNPAKSLKSLLGKGEVKIFLEDVYKNPIVRQLDLSGFLLKPVQRICKYPLLLREMIKYTATDSSDLIVLNRAIDRMNNAVGTINECAKRLNGMKPILEVQSRFSEKINIANVNRFLVREDIIQVLFSDEKKSRKLFLFNDLLILARKDWRDKHHVIEKSTLKDIRVSDISEIAGDGSGLLEIEILPSSAFDPPNRYIVSTASSDDKMTWLEAYKSLARYHVKSKNLADVTMTSSSADRSGEDDELQQPIETDRKVSIAVEQLEMQNKQTTEKVDLLEKRVKEREAKIKEWEINVQSLEANFEENQKKIKDELITTQDQLEAKEAAFLKLSEEKDVLRRDRDQFESNLVLATKANLDSTKQISLLKEANSEIQSINEQNEELIGRQDVHLDELKEERSQIFLKVQDIAVTLGIKVDKKLLKSKLSSSVSQLSSSNGNLLPDISTMVFEMLVVICERAEELNSSLMEKKNANNSLSDQLASLRKDVFERESELHQTVAKNNSFQKRVNEMEKIQEEYANQIANLKKEKKSLEASLDHQMAQSRNFSIQSEQSIFDLKASLNRESEDSKMLSGKLNETRQMLQSKEAIIIEHLDIIQQLNYRLRSTEGDISMKDSAAKQLMDLANARKNTLDEIEILLEKSKSDSLVSINLSGGIVAQMKSLFLAYNQSLKEGVERYLELQQANAKQKDKLQQVKDDLDERVKDSESLEMLIYQLKNNLEQARASNDHHKLTQSSLERQLKQHQLSLDEARKECSQISEKFHNAQGNLANFGTKNHEIEKKYHDTQAVLKELQEQIDLSKKTLKQKDEKLNDLEVEIENKDQIIKDIGIKNITLVTDILKLIIGTRISKSAKTDQLC
jgi:chromosome segregation ATPase